MKSQVKSILTALMFLVIGIFIGTWIIPFNQNEKAIHQEIQMPESKQSYVCSMHPSVKQDKPGLCPICGMQLTLMTVQSNSNDVFLLTESVKKLSGFERGIVKKQAVEKNLKLPAKWLYNQSFTVSESAQFEGRIDSLFITYEGQKVKIGDLIAFIYAPSVAQWHRELIEASIQENETMIQSIEARFRLAGFSEDLIKALRVERVPRELFPLIATKSGIISNLSLVIGKQIKKGELLFMIQSIDQWWFQAEIPVSDVDLIPFVTQISTFLPNGKKLDMKIDFISPNVNPVSQTITIRSSISLPAKESIYHNKIETAWIQTQFKDKLVVPKSSVLWAGEVSFVYVIEKNNLKKDVIRLKAVRTGTHFDDNIEIIEGLLEGEEIVINGVYKLDSAVQLAGYPSMMTYQIAPPLNSIIKPISAQAEKYINQLTEYYMNLKDHLVESNLELILIALNQMNDFLETPIGQSVSSESPNLEIKKTIQKFRNEMNISEARELFIELSEQMIVLQKQVDQKSKTVFVMYCPMANQDKGARWLSYEKEIRNPYFGSAMLTCGEVTEVLK